MSSAVSAGNAAMNHLRDWTFGTNGEWTSMAVISKGEYGVPKGLCFSYPVTCKNGWWHIVKGLEFTE
jgi:malate/lactate dehydrogenase